MTHFVGVTKITKIPPRKNEMSQSKDKKGKPTRQPSIYNQTAKETTVKDCNPISLSDTKINQLK